MSRSPINGDVIAFCGKGMENLTSIDAGRLRIHIGSKPKARGVREESEGGQNPYTDDFLVSETRVYSL